MWKAISVLLSEEPFYGHIIASLVKIESEKVPTLGVALQNGKVYLLYNPKFYDSLKQFVHKKGVIKHEVLHVVLKHLTRDDLDDHKVANIAMDLVINQLVGRENLPSDDKHYGQYVEDFQKRYGADKFPLNETTDFYYHQLKKLKDKGEDLGEEYDHHWQVMGGDGESMKPIDKLSEAEKTLIDAQARELIERARTQSPEGWSKLPGNIRGMFEALLEKNKPQLPWKVILKRFVAKAMSSSTRFTMKRFSKRFGTRPGLKKEPQLHLCLALDSSGSVSDEQFAQFLGEVDAIVRRGKAQVTVADCDCGVQAVYPYKKGMELKRTGYGGTSFDPVFQWISENKLTRKFDAVIYLTDGYASPPSIRVNLPTLFVITTDGADVPGYKNLRLPNA